MKLLYTAGRIRGVASSLHHTSSSSSLLSRRRASVVVFPSSLVSGRRFSTMSTDDTKSTSMSSKSKYYTIGITGSTGLIGTALQNEIMSLGQEQNKGNSGSISSGGDVTTVNGKPVRIITFHRGNKAEILNDPKSFFNDTAFTKKKSITWNPYANTNNDDNDSDAVAIDTSVIQHLDAIIHLSGENISTGEQGSVLAPFGIRPWTESKKKEIINSRTITTSALASAIYKSGNTNCDFIVASGIGVYGNDYFKNDNNDNEKEAADETMDITNTKGFLANVSRLWEAASKIPEPEPVVASIVSSESSEQEQVQATQGSNSNHSTSNRVCQLRNGVVLSTLGGALGKLYPIFYVGGGGIVGDTNGNQYFPFISSRDMSRAILHILQTSELDGVININAPIPATNKDFTIAMGTIMNRPVVIPFPKFAVQLLFGEMGEEILLGGTKAIPKKLVDSGFQFLDPTIKDAVRFAIQGE